MPDSSVPITPGSGINVDVSQITHLDRVGTLADRQRMVIADDSNSDATEGTAWVIDNHLSVADEDVRQLLGALLKEVRMLRWVVQNWTGAQAIDVDDHLSLDERS